MPLITQSLLEHHNGTLVLTSPDLVRIAPRFNQDAHEQAPPVVELLSPAEYESIAGPASSSLAIPTGHVFSIDFLQSDATPSPKLPLIVWNHANIWRRSVGLTPRYFFISALSGSHGESATQTWAHHLLEKVVIDQASLVHADEVELDHCVVALEDTALVSLDRTTLACCPIDAV